MNPPPLLSRLSLWQMLTLPYIALVLLLAATIGALSYHAGREAVDTLSTQLLTETVNRIAQAVEKHLSGSDAVLEAAFPQGVPAPDDLPTALPALRTRLWVATAIHRDVHRYAYYGDADGRFVGLWRRTANDAELRLRLTGTGPRSLATFSGIDGTPGPALPEDRVFEPRERPWFGTGMASATPGWSPVYIDFKSAELVVSRVRRVVDVQGRPRGVVATDLPLAQVDRFLRGLAVRPGGVAMVVEGDGRLVGVSRGQPLAQDADGRAARLNAGDSGDTLVAEAWRAWQAGRRLDGASIFKAADGHQVHLAHARLNSASGLDWAILVAVPRADVLEAVVAGIRQSAALGAVASAAVLLVGLAVLGVVVRDLRGLAEMARRIGDGLTGAPVAHGVLARRDALGDLARSLDDLQHRLLTDRLTGLSNREALTRRLEERLLRPRRRDDAAPFALLFIDLNRFKQVNDRHGHALGDAVLQELGGRLQQRLRAGDAVARWAGDEFVVMLDNVQHRADAESVRRQVEQAMAEPVLALADKADGLQTAGAAVGLALYPGDGADVAALVEAADRDMYRRKGLRAA